MSIILCTCIILYTSYCICNYTFCVYICIYQLQLGNVQSLKRTRRPPKMRVSNRNLLTTKGQNLQGRLLFVSRRFGMQKLKKSATKNLQKPFHADWRVTDWWEAKQRPNAENLPKTPPIPLSPGGPQFVKFSEAPQNWQKRKSGFALGSAGLSVVLTSQKIHHRQGRKVEGVEGWRFTPIFCKKNGVFIFKSHFCGDRYHLDLTWSIYPSKSGFRIQKNKKRNVILLVVTQWHPGDIGQLWICSIGCQGLGLNSCLLGDKLIPNFKKGNPYIHLAALLCNGPLTQPAAKMTMV